MSEYILLHIVEGYAKPLVELARASNKRDALDAHKRNDTRATVALTVREAERLVSELQSKIFYGV